MKITILESTTNTLKFILHSNISFANSIRRILLSEIPIVAIEIVEIRENRTILADEMISHRLGLVPIRYTGKLIQKEDCDCDGFCGRCSIKFNLKVSNDSEIENQIITVTGDDLITKDISARCHKTLIVKLAPNQKIDMTCIATLGIGKSHAKFCPITTVKFNYDKSNSTRATKLWKEQNVNEEWKNVNQKDEVDWEKVQEIEMEIEVVEGIGNPIHFLEKAIEIFKKKISRILDNLN